MTLVKQQIHTHLTEYHNMTTNLIRNIATKNYDEANKNISESVILIMEKKLFEMKKFVAAKMCEQMGLMGPSRAEKLRTGVLEEDEIEEQTAKTDLQPSANKTDLQSTSNKTDLGSKTSSPNQRSVDDVAVDDLIRRNTRGLEYRKSRGMLPPGHEITTRLEEDQIDEMQIGKSSGMSNMARDMRLSQEPKWNEANPKLRGYHNAEPRVPNVDPHAFKSNTPVYSVAPNKQVIAKYIKPNLEEETEEQLDEARVKIVKARIRGGKIQRRKKVSNVEGYKVQGGQLKRMSPVEKRNRKLGQRRGKIKRRAKLTRTLMKRQKSLRKRQSLGI